LYSPFFAQLVEQSTPSTQYADIASPSHHASPLLTLHKQRRNNIVAYRLEIGLSLALFHTHSHSPSNTRARTAQSQSHTRVKARTLLPRISQVHGLRGVGEASLCLLALRLAAVTRRCAW
jgi:hypothetical protein